MAVFKYYTILEEMGSLCKWHLQGGNWRKEEMFRKKIRQTIG